MLKKKHFFFKSCYTITQFHFIVPFYCIQHFFKSFLKCFSERFVVWQISRKKKRKVFPYVSLIPHFAFCIYKILMIPLASSVCSGCGIVKLKISVDFDTLFRVVSHFVPDKVKLSVVICCHAPCLLSFPISD